MARIVLNILSNIRNAMNRILPEPLCLRIYSSWFTQKMRTAVFHLPSKRETELGFWKKMYKEHGGEFKYEYKKMMTEAGDITDESFFDNRIVVDIGCGPGGSLCWIEKAKARIGVDPLTERYTAFGIEKHDMVYLQACAEKIPLPSRYADVIFCVNSLDHVDNPVKAMAEIRRILKPGGHFIGSINLRKITTINEPHRLTESGLREYLFKGWIREYYLIRPEGEQLGDLYRLFRDDPPEGYRPGFMILRCRYQKPDQEKRDT